MNKAALEKERDALQELISESQDKLMEINQKLWKIEAEERLKRLDEMNVRKGSLLVGFALHPDYHYTMVKCIQVVELVNGARRIDCITQEYRVDDSDYSFKAREERITPSVFCELTNKFRFYSVDATTYMDVLKELISLTVTVSNVSELETKISGGNTDVI